MGTLIVGFIILVLIISAVFKLIKDKKSGKKCSGCSSEGLCSHFCTDCIQKDDHKIET